MQRHPAVIASSFEEVRPSAVFVKHSFELTSSNPIYQKARLMSPVHKEVVHKEVDRMLSAGIITPVESAWISPVVLASTKDGSLRFCVDYRKLISFIVADRWPLPLIDEILYDMRSGSVFTTIDLSEEHWQIKVEETCQDKTAFICRHGTYQFEVMPFGSVKSQVTCKRMIENVLLKLLNVRCCVDDVVIFSEDEEAHLVHLKKVFDLLEENELRLRIKKCSFMQANDELLGHIVDENGVHVDDHKVDKIKKAPAPTSRNKLRPFLGLASYYQRFIPRFASISKPLVEKTSEKFNFLWTDAMQESFSTLKSKLITGPALAYPDYEKPFIISADASSKAIRAILFQNDADGREHLAYYASRVLNLAEINYSAFERGGTRRDICPKHIRHYLLSNRFKLYTDNQALKHPFNMSDPHGRIAR